VAVVVVVVAVAVALSWPSLSSSWPLRWRCGGVVVRRARVFVGSIFALEGVVIFFVGIGQQFFRPFVAWFSALDLVELRAYAVRRLGFVAAWGPAARVLFVVLEVEKCFFPLLVEPEALGYAEALAVRQP
jgi:hypothetical protein